MRHISFATWFGALMQTDGDSADMLRWTTAGVRTATATVAIAGVTSRREALLGDFFSAEEVSGLADIPDRTIAGWIAAKKAVASLLGPSCHPASVVIDRCDSGKPHVRILSADAPGVHVSISHTQESAYSLACMEGPA